MWQGSVRLSLSLLCVSFNDSHTTGENNGICQGKNNETLSINKDKLEDATRSYPVGWHVYDPKNGKELSSTETKNNQID